MHKLATMSMDIADEVMQENVECLLGIISDLPESVKIAHIPTDGEIEDVNEDGFAAILYHPKHGFIRKYANYNADLTMLNSKMFLYKEDELPDELCKVAGANLYRAHTEFNLDVPEGLKKYASDDFVDNSVDLTKLNKVAYALKVESVVEELAKLAYALPEASKFPIHDEFHIKKAQEFFEKHATTMDIPSRIEYAKNVYEATFEHAVLPTQKICKYASLLVDEFSDEAKFMINARRNYLKDDKHAYLDGLITKMAEITPLETCMYLEEIDKTFGLTDTYNKYLYDAPLSILGHQKEASIKLRSGKVLTEAMLINVQDNEKVAELITDDLLKALGTKNGLDVFSKMPDNLQNTVYEIL